MSNGDFAYKVLALESGRFIGSGLDDSGRDPEAIMSEAADEWQANLPFDVHIEPMDVAEHHRLMGR